MLPNGQQPQQYLPAHQNVSNPTMDGSRSFQNGSNPNLNAAFSNIHLNDKSPSPAMPQFRPNLPVFRPPASPQSSQYAGEFNGTSTPTLNRPTINQQSINGLPGYPQTAYQAPPQLIPSVNQAYNSFPNPSMNQVVPGGGLNGPSLQRYPAAPQQSVMPAVNAYSSVPPSLPNGNFNPHLQATQHLPPGQPSYGTPSAFPSPQTGNFVGQAQLPNGNVPFQVRARCFLCRVYGVRKPHKNSVLPSKFDRFTVHLFPPLRKLYCSASFAVTSVLIESDI